LDRYLDVGRPYRPIEVPLASGASEPGTVSIGLALEMFGELDRRRTGLQPGQSRRLARIAALWDRARSARGGDYERMLRHELKSQLDTWGWYLDDCARGGSERADDYPHEVTARRRIQALLDEASANHLDVGRERARTAGLDGALRAMFVSGPFAGPPTEAARRPADVYWWLYGTVHGAGRD
jgi:hypothetical protein